MSLNIYNNFKKKFHRLKHKHIILYGLNYNSLEIYRKNKDFKIVGIDCNEKIIPKNIKKVSIKKHLKIRPIIVITTKHDSSKIIFSELKSKFNSNIEIFFLDGSNEVSKINSKKVGYNIQDIKKLSKLVKNFDVISFDLFDTLIFRNCSKPRDLFEILEFYYKEKYQRKIKFSELRLSVQTKLEKDGKSVNIYEIYNYLNKKLNLSKNKLIKVIDTEILLEKLLSNPNKGLIKIFNLCKKKKKKIYITSDFHLPKKILKDILDYNKIVGYEDIISSCDYGFFKKGGKLFDVLKNRNINKKILHIGDNIDSDILGSKKSGIKSFKIFTSRELILNSNLNDVYGHIQNNNDRLCLGLLQNKLYEISLDIKNLKNNKRSIKISLENFGYFFLGNLIFEYLQWVKNETKKRSINNLLFASREGYFLSKIYKEFFSNKKQNVHYFKSSRFAAHNISFENKNDIINSFKKHRFFGSFKDLLKNRFGINPNKDEKNNNLIINTDRNNNLDKLLQNYISLILNNSKKRKKNYLNYLKQLIINGNIAICDISLFATIQNALNKVTKYNLTGFYIPTQSNYIETKNIKFMKLNKSFEKKYFILESILTAPHGTFLYIDNKLRFIHEKKMSNQKYFKNREKIIIGVKNYINDIQKLNFVNNINYKDHYNFGIINNYLFNQINNKFFYYDNKIFNSLYFDNKFVRKDENKISI